MLIVLQYCVMISGLCIGTNDLYKRIHLYKVLILTVIMFPFLPSLFNFIPLFSFLMKFLFLYQFFIHIYPPSFRHFILLLNIFCPFPSLLLFPFLCIFFISHSPSHINKNISWWLTKKAVSKCSSCWTIL